VPDPYVPPPDPLIEPSPDPNARMNDGVQAAVETYNGFAVIHQPDVPIQQPGTPELEAKIARLEETLKALCDAFMSAYRGEPLPWKE
jgi:hypothetical protein